MKDSWKRNLFNDGAKMRKKSKVLLGLLTALSCAGTSSSALGQDYGFGQVPQVPQVPPANFDQSFQQPIVDPPSYQSYSNQFAPHQAMLFL